MSITIRDNRPQEKRVSLLAYLEHDHSDHCLVECVEYIITQMADDTYCAIALQDEITFTIYETASQLMIDLALEDSTEVVILDAIDITYHKQMK